MAIAFANSATGTGDFVSSITFAIDVGTGSDRVLLVLATTDRSGTTTIDSCTYNGTSMTAHTAGTSSPDGIDYRAFYLANPTSGSNNVVVTYSGSGTKPKALALAYTGVDQTTPVSGLTNNSAFSSTPSWTVSSATGDLVVSMAMQTGRTAVTPTSPATERMDQLIAGSMYGFVFEEAGAASVTIDGSSTGGSCTWWGTGLSLKAASAAGLVVNPLSGIGGAAAHPLVH